MMRSVMPPPFIRLPAMIKPGMHSSTNESTPAKIFSGLIRRVIIKTQAAIKEARATGTPERKAISIAATTINDLKSNGLK